MALLVREDNEFVLEKLISSWITSVPGTSTACLANAVLFHNTFRRDRFKKSHQVNPENLFCSQCCDMQRLLIEIRTLLALELDNGGGDLFKFLQTE